MRMEMAREFLNGRRDLTTAPPNSPLENVLPRSGGRCTVLLGDEHGASEHWHKTAARLLASQGVETVVARTGRHALNLIEDSLTGGGQRIHVAVLDQGMTDMTGLQVLRRLHEHLTRRTPPVPTTMPAILLAPVNEQREAQTGSGGGGLSSGLMHDALTVKVFSVLPRPVDTNLLLDTMARALLRFYAGKWPGGEQK